MKLHTSVGPNPRVVRMFMAERGVELETIDVDIIGGENLKYAIISTKFHQGTRLSVTRLNSGPKLACGTVASTQKFSSPCLWPFAVPRLLACLKTVVM